MELNEKAEIKESIPEGYWKSKVGVIPNDWDVEAIGSLTKPVKNPVLVDLKKEYVQLGIRSHGKGIFYKEKVTGEELGNKRVFWVEANCFIVNIVFAWERAIARTSDNDKGIIASHRFPMYKPVKGKVDLDYLTYFFKSKRGGYILELASPGGAGRNKTLGQKEFAKSLIPVPKYKEQKKIAEILLTQDKIIDLKEELVMKKEKQKKYLMQRLLNPNSLYFKRLDEFQDKWKEDKLLNLGKSFNGLTGKTQEHFGVGEPYLSYKDVYSNTFSKFSNNNLVSIENGEKQNHLRYGDLVFTVSSETQADVATSSIYMDDKKMYLNSFCFGIRLHNFESIIPSFAGYYFRSDYFRRKIYRLAQGSTRYNISKTMLMEESIVFPKVEEQIRISEVLSRIDEEILVIKKDIAQQKLRKNALMQLLLTGKKRVKYNF